MKVNDGREFKVFVGVDDLKVGKVYEDKDRDILMWTNKGQMVILSSPAASSYAGLMFFPEAEDLYTELDAEMSIK